MQAENELAYQSAYHTAQVKDHPEPGDEAALLGLGRVGHHDSALSRPQDTSADTKEGASEGDVAIVVGVFEADVGRDVDAVADAAEGERPANADSIGDGSREEADDGEGGVEGGVGITVRLTVEQPTASETVEGVEHSWKI